MGLLLFRTHLLGENNSPQSAFYTDSFAIRQRWRQCNVLPSFLSYSSIRGEGDNPGTRLTPIKSLFAVILQLLRLDQRFATPRFWKRRRLWIDSGVKFAHVECVEQKMPSLTNFQIWTEQGQRKKKKKRSANVETYISPVRSDVSSFTVCCVIT